VLVNATHTILLVEDGDDDVILLERALSKSQCPARLVRCENGRHCHDYLRRPSVETPPPRLIILDQQLGDTTGLQLLLWIKRQKPLQTIPVIILAGILSNSEKQALWEAGAHAIHIKPADPGELHRFIAVLCEYWLDWVVP
jgi:DNA-binding response OmpR family regulator